MLANIISFIVLNWAEQMSLVYMLFKIRNIKDELNIRNEMCFIIVLYLVVQFVYFLTQ